MFNYYEHACSLVNARVTSADYVSDALALRAQDTQSQAENNVFEKKRRDRNPATKIRFTFRLVVNLPSQLVATCSFVARFVTYTRTSVQKSVVELTGP